MPRKGFQTNWHEHPGVRSGSELTFGERAADAMRKGMGSWTFVGSFFLVLLLWAAANTLYISRVAHGNEFDPYPCILLNLFLSMLAGVQAAALLIAAKRADSISSELAMHDARTDDEAKSIIGEVDRKVGEVLDLVREVHGLTATAPGDRPKRGGMGE
jgi:uncharacterized membrane protein